MVQRHAVQPADCPPDETADPGSVWEKSAGRLAKAPWLSKTMFGRERSCCCAIGILTQPANTNGSAIHTWQRILGRRAARIAARPCIATIPWLT